MTHDELIEAAARSLWIAHGFNPAHWDGTTGGQWAAYMVSQKPHYLNLARAAISVIAPAVLEEAASECDKWVNQYRQAHKNAQARKQRQEARDFESMAMSSAFRAHEIRALKTRYER